MKVISKTKAVLLNDREGILEEFIEIDITIEAKNDVVKIYSIKTVDSIVFNKGTEQEATTMFKNRHGEPQIKTYFKTYEEYDQQKEILEQYYPTDLTGSEKDDYLLQMGLLLNLEQDPIYNVEFEAR